MKHHAAANHIPYHSIWFEFYETELMLTANANFENTLNEFNLNEEIRKLISI